MSYSLNSLDGDYIRGYIGAIIGVLKGDTRTFDNDSHVVFIHGKDPEIFALPGSRLGAVRRNSPQELSDPVLQLITNQTPYSTMIPSCTLEPKLPGMLVT